MSEEAADYSLKKDLQWGIQIENLDLRKRKLSCSPEPTRNVKAKVWMPECTLPPKSTSPTRSKFSIKSFRPIQPRELVDNGNENTVQNLSITMDILEKSPLVEEDEDRIKTVRRYKHALRDEEMKLLLLKKVFLSQNSKENHYQPIPAAVIEKKIPKPLMPTVQQHLKPGLMPKNLALKDVPIYKQPVPAHSNSQKSSTTLKTAKTWNPMVVPSVSNQVIEQRQEVAKLALRKQLEETLLQIPVPKAPVPELHFIPSSSNQEFVCLVGLEWIVELLTTHGGSSAYKRVEPFRCSQCRTDFTAKWKWHKSSTSHMSVICESCAASNSKESVKAEHTNRLKSAFMKVLQQEYEMEKSLLASSSSSSSASPATTHTSSSSTHGRHGSNSMQMPKSVHHRSSSNKNSNHKSSSSVHSKMSAGQSLLQSPAHMQQQMAVAAAAAAIGRPQPAHLLSYPSSYLQNYANYQRNYLLDMLNPSPSSRSSSNLRHSWKS